MNSIKIEKATPEKLHVLDVENWSEWSCEPSTFEWEYTADELSYIKAGRVIVTAHGKDYDIKAGDLVVFPHGLKCTWKVIEKITKNYSFK